MELEISLTTSAFGIIRASACDKKLVRELEPYKKLQMAFAIRVKIAASLFFAPHSSFSSSAYLSNGER